MQYDNWSKVAVAVQMPPMKYWSEIDWDNTVKYLVEFFLLHGTVGINFWATI